MSRYSKIILSVISVFAVPAGLFAQSDICSRLPAVGSAANNGAEVVVEQMKERANQQSLQDRERANWSVQMFPVKYLDSAESVKALCIFAAEIVPQPALHMISVRALASSMAAIADAIKRLDIPQAGPKSVELTVNVLAASDQDETLRPTPASLRPVVDQLKGVLSYKQFYLLETFLGNTLDAHHVSLSGDVRGLFPPPAPGSGPPRDTPYNFQADLRIGNGDSASASVRLSNLRFNLNNGMSINTDVDIPQGKQVVVGKTSAGDRAYILVVSAKILN